MNKIIIDLSRDSKFDELGLKRLKESYMMHEETSPQERFAYVCKQVGTDRDHCQRLYEYTSKHWLSLSTPLLSFGKANHGLPISCYLSWIEDTKEGLIDTLSEVNHLSMLGGGVGVGVGIRTSDNKSTGVMSHLNTYDACSLAYKQDGVRRGSYAMYLNNNHPDVLQFIEMRKPTGDHNIRCLNLHHGLNISDSFMELIEKCEGGGNVDDTWNLIDPHTKKITSVGARDLWQRILETRMKTGEPYICFIDTCNKHMYDFQKKKGLTIRQSNLCVAPETLILTEEGQFRIKDLENQNVKVWNGDEFSEVTIIKTGIEKELIKVVLSNGCVLECTPQHKFITESYANCGILKATRIEAANLEEGTKLIKFKLPTLLGNSIFDIKYPYTHGFFCGTRYGKPQYLDGKKITMNGHKFKVPINASLACRMEWLAGYLDAAGCIAQNGDMKVASINLDVLKQIQLLLIGMGVETNISLSKQDVREEIWKMTISSYGLAQGFHANAACVTVKEIIQTGRIDDTYCFSEPFNHAGVFNGILTGQCSEIILPTDSTRTAVCCLSSLNLEYYDEWKDNDLFIKDVMEMLDNALTIFIEKAPSTISRAVNSAKKERSIGIGVLGFHSFLQQKNIAFESDEAAKINIDIFTQLRSKIDAFNLVLGSLRGSPEDAEGTGRRFCCTMAVAPTATSSIIMGNTSPSVEPFRANAYRQDTLSGSFLNKNKYLSRILAQRLNVKELNEVWSNIISNGGSVQQLPNNLLSEQEKRVFKTAFEINQRWVIKHAADRQKYIDQSQSINLFLKPDIHKRELHSLHLNAWKSGLKTLYYLRSEKIANADKISSNHMINSIQFTNMKERNMKERNTKGWETEKICKLTNGKISSECFACE